MNKKAKKWLSLGLGILGTGVIACGAGIGIVSCSSTNSSTTTSPNPTSSSSSSSTTNSSSSSKTTSSTSSSKTTSSSPKDTKSTSSSPTNTPPTNTTGLVTLNTFLTTPTTKEAVGQLINTNVYACGSKITLNANYTPPPDVTSGSDETDTITYAWYAGDDLITGQVNSQCNIAGIFSTTTYKVVVTCQVYKETATNSSSSDKNSSTTSKTDSTTGSTSTSSSSSTSDKNTTSSNQTSSATTNSSNSSSKTTGIVLASQTPSDTDSKGTTTSTSSTSSSDDSGSKSTTTKPTTTKTLIKTYTCNTTLTVTVDYSNLSATLVYGANQMGTITSNAQTALAVNLQYKFQGNGSTQPAGALYSFSTTDLKKLPASTISFERYSFGQWHQINAANTSANSIQNLDYSYIPTGIYPLRAQLNIGSSVLTSNMLKVNTTYDGSVLDLNTIPTSLQSTYSYTSLMLLYLQQSLKADGNNAPFMQLVNSWGQGYMFVEATTSDSYKQVDVNDLTDFNVSWINAKDHSDGLMVSATVNVANNKGLELLGYSNYQNKDYAYTTSNNLLIPNGDVISWTLPFGGMQSLQWTITNDQVSSVNWNITNYADNVFYNYGTAANPSWHTYDWACTNQYGHPSIADSNIYWGYKVSTSNGENVLSSLISSNSFYTNLKPTDSSYLLYNDFPMLSTNSSNIQIGYITLTSQCVSLLNTLYEESIAGIASLENN